MQPDLKYVGKSPLLVQVVTCTCICANELQLHVYVRVLQLHVHVGNFILKHYSIH